MGIAAQAAAQAAPAADPTADPSAAPADPSAPPAAGGNDSSDDDPGDANAPGPTFTKPDISSAIPPDMKDSVDRIEAAGLELMYSPAMRDNLKQAVQSPDPTAKVLAENVVGLMLTMDQKAGKSGLPPGAIMPATVELLGEAATLMVKAGRPVSEDDFKHAMQIAFVLNGKKMGGTGAQIMDAANKSLPADQQVAGGAPPDGPNVSNDPITPPAQAGAPAGGAPAGGAAPDPTQAGGAPPGGSIASAAAAQAQPDPDEVQQ